MSLRSLFALAFVLPAAAFGRPSETVTLIGRFQGKEVGKAVYRLATNADGTIVKFLSLKVNVDGAVFESRVTVHLAANGSPLDRDEFGALNGKTQTNAAIVFQPKKATFKNRMDGHSIGFASPKALPVMDPSETWFLSVRPKVGQTVGAFGLTTEKGWWKQQVTYHGDRPMQLGGKCVSGHVIEIDGDQGKYERVLDDRGVPLQFEVPHVPGLIFARE